MHKFCLTYIMTLIGVLNLMAQPNTDIYLLDISQKKNQWSVGNAINISQNEGYDNQPQFWPDGRSILYARTVDGQTEIARYFIESGETQLLSNTKQGSEYSPTPMPDGRISSIRLDTTGLQLLYAYRLDGSYEILVPEEIIGYHCWIDSTRLAAFVLGDPSQLTIIDTKTLKKETVATRIGRSLHRIPGNEHVSLLDKNEIPWKIKSYDPNTREMRELASVVGSGEDYCWSPSGDLLMADGASLFLFQAGQWKKIATLDHLGISNITRMAVSPDGKKLVIAAE